MSVSYLEPAGIAVLPASLAIPRAKQLAALLAQHDLPYVQFIECRQLTLHSGESAETVVFDTDVERPQHLTHDVHRIERISATFTAKDDTYPEVLALRSDFPRVPHTNLRNTDYPRSLCLYDQPWWQISLRWTPIAFVERIRHWLAETAKGTLHRDDQPLEPLLFGSKYSIVLPPDLFTGKNGGDHEELQIRLATQAADCRVLLAKRGKAEGGLPFLAISFVARPQTHGVIRHNPQSLQELDEFLQPAGILLLEQLRNQIADWSKELRDKRLLIVLGFPLTRNGKDVVEASNLWVFMTTKSIAEIGVDIGILEKTAHGYGQVMQGSGLHKGQNIPLEVMLPQFDFTRESAAASSGLQPDPRKVVAVGSGALGSQLVKTLASSGFGDWCIVDEDILLPHNLARHQLGRYAIGHPKAFSLAAEVNSLFEEQEAPKWFQTDILRPGDNAEELVKKFETAELVLDIAASIPVSDIWR